ncbi:MAG: carbohydrate ABC transporter permease [Armatimonadetes bacterium]|nr:carbohydrate ABC transporter permease [Armatimonadota bacterium]
MPVPWTAALATITFWLGALIGLRGLYGLLRAWMEPQLRSGLSGSAVMLGVGTAALLASAALFPTAGIGLPLVWPVLPIQLWMATVCGICVVNGLVGMLLKKGFSNPLTILYWLVAGVVCFLLPRANPVPFKLLSGHIMLGVPGALALAGLAVLAVLCMSYAEKSAKSSSLLKGMAIQLALLAGTLVFGLPFLFLLVTSFKEDKDMSSPNGIIWVPRVEQTAPVMNPNHPYYEAKYKGIKVQADLEQVRPDGTLSLRIAHPLFFGGFTFIIPRDQAKEIPRQMPLVTADLRGQKVEGVVFEEMPDGSQDVELRSPAAVKGQRHLFPPKATEKVRPVSLRWKNYFEALEYLPPEAQYGWTYLRNTLWLVVMNVLGALVSCSLVAYAFARLRFPGREALFKVMLSTMMLPAAVTLLPQFLIFRQFGWIDTLKPMWVTSWFAAAFNVFMLRQFFQQVPYELEDAAKIDGCTYLRSLWSVMLPQVKPALAVIAIMTFLGAWNNFMGPLVYSSSPETLPISYAVQLFNGDRNGDPGLLMAFVTMSLVPVIALFAFAQRFFIEGAALSGFGGR